MKNSLRMMLILVAFICLAGTALAQEKVKGIITDLSNESPLPGATIFVEDANKGTVSQIDGSFELQLPVGKHTLKFSFVGYLDGTAEIELKKGVVLDLGEIDLEPNSVGLTEILVVSNFARDRKTPISVSTIQPVTIEEKLGTQEFPEILKSTPSVYATKEGGGYGDGRINLRGFDSDNIGVLINGVPINDMENGKVYWSNWSGLSDVTRTMQVQRGLGASRLALSSVGGTINIITRSTDAKKGGSIYYGIGVDGYSKKAFTLSTGILDNGWAITMSGSMADANGNGFVQSTSFEAYSYFANVSKTLGKKNRLSFTVFGAPQWHNQRYTKHLIQDFRDNPAGVQWNSDFGYWNGEKYNTAYNYYHKPQMSLNHFLEINDHSSLSTAVYASISDGGGRRVSGIDGKWLKYNPIDGRPYDGITKLTPEGYLDFDAVAALNASSLTGSSAIISNSVNSHKWFGLLSTYSNDLGLVKLTTGIDSRYYRGLHASQIEDLMGGLYYLDNSDENRAAGTPLHKGDYISYHNNAEVGYLGAFAMGELTLDNFTAFASLAGSENAYRRKDFFNYTVGNQESDWKFKPSFSIKGGANYNIDKKNNVFLNGGFFTKAPYFNNIFLNYTNEFNEDVKNERVITGEIGYGYRTKKLSLDVSGYWTNWKDKALVRSFGDYRANIPNINARHMGIEFMAKYNPIDDVTIRFMTSIGDWIWQNDVDFTLYDPETDQIVGEYNAYLADIHVGDAAQTTAALGVDINVLKGVKIGFDANYYDRLYAYFDPVLRTSATDTQDSWEMPSYLLVDANIRWNFKVANLRATFYGKINNLLDTEYIADSQDGATHDEYTSLVYYGFKRTASIGLKIKF